MRCAACRALRKAGCHLIVGDCALRRPLAVGLETVTGLRSVNGLECLCWSQGWVCQGDYIAQRAELERRQ
jgi:hypothetical protein